MRPIRVTKTLAASSGNNIALSQTTAGAGNLVLNGAAVSGGVATLDTMRQVAITSGGDDHLVNFTVNGTNDAGISISETLAGPNISTVATNNSFKTVTSIAVNGAVAQAVTVGTNGVGATMPIPIDQYISPNNPSLAVEVTGTLNYTVQYTFDDIWTLSNQGSLNWNNVTALAAQTGNKDTSLSAPVTAVRMVINSGSGSGLFIIVQPGIGST